MQLYAVGQEDGICERTAAHDTALHCWADLPVPCPTGPAMARYPLASARRGTGGAAARSLAHVWCVDDACRWHVLSQYVGWSGTVICSTYDESYCPFSLRDVCGPL